MPRRYAVFESLEADVMTTIVRQQGQASLKTLVGALQRPPSNISKATTNLENRRWVLKHALPAVKSARPVILLASSPEFYQAVQTAATSVDTLPDRERTLFAEATTAAQTMEVSTQKTPEADRATITFLGTAALLGQEHDLQAMTEGNWFKGEIGWKTLMTMQALRTTE